MVDDPVHAALEASVFPHLKHVAHIVNIHMKSWMNLVPLLQRMIVMSRAKSSSPSTGREPCEYQVEHDIVARLVCTT